MELGQGTFRVLSDMYLFSCATVLFDYWGLKVFSFFLHCGCTLGFLKELLFRLSVLFSADRPQMICLNLCSAPGIEHLSHWLYFNSPIPCAKPAMTSQGAGVRRHVWKGSFVLIRCLLTCLTSRHHSSFHILTCSRSSGGGGGGGVASWLPCCCCWLLLSREAISAILRSICSSRSRMDILNWLSAQKSRQSETFSCVSNCAAFMTSSVCWEVLRCRQVAVPFQSNV